jgi:hypothetical protein
LEKSNANPSDLLLFSRESLSTLTPNYQTYPEGTAQREHFEMLNLHQAVHLQRRFVFTAHRQNKISAKVKHGDPKVCWNLLPTNLDMASLSCHDHQLFLRSFWLQ